MRRQFPTRATLGLALSTLILLSGLPRLATAQEVGDDFFDRILTVNATNEFGGRTASPSHCVPQSQCGPQYQPLRPYSPDVYDPEAVAPDYLQQPAPTPDLFAAAPQGALGASNTFAAAFTNTGYIDPAIPMTQFRLRFDAAYRSDFPDRAEFQYARWRLQPDGSIDPDAPGPPLGDTRVDFQDIAAHLEYAFNERFSVFTELPVRFLNPDVNDNTAGFADMNFGFKYALIACPDEYLTFQLRTYAPTGAARRGLGTDHFSLEPGILYFRQLSQRAIFEGEFRHWIPIDGTSGHAGNVMRYGVGLGYTIHESCQMRITPVTEFVGWTVLNGQKSHIDRGLLDASGDTIVNMKVGVRMGFGQATTPLGSNNSFYIGYGRALTGHVWYQDILRLEYRMIF
jgi:hypothetical protein